MKQFINRVKQILTSGRKRTDRTGTGTISKFGMIERYDLLGMRLPIETTKFVAARPLKVELLWFLKGDTNNETLRAQNVKIWNEWAVREEDRLLPREVIDKEAEKRFGTKPHVTATRGDLGTMGLKTHSDVPVGSLGPIYGEQWRKWPNGIPRAKIREILAYGGPHLEKIKMIEELLNDGEPDTIDQIADLIKNIKARPFSRRHLVTAWNPSVLPDESISPQANVLKGKQALAACHTVFQFDVEDMTLEEMAKWQASYDCVHKADIVSSTLERIGLKGYDAYRKAILAAMIECGIEDVVKWRKEEGVPTQKISSLLFQRSDDVALGEGFNVPSYCILTRMVAQVVGMAAGEFIHVTGNTHIYLNHVDAITEQVEREPKDLPFLWINPMIKDIDSFTMDDIEISEYNHHPAIKYEVAV
jgi:thymidylate synthase